MKNPPKADCTPDGISIMQNKQSMDSVKCHTFVNALWLEAKTQTTGMEISVLRPVEMLKL